MRLRHLTRGDGLAVAATVGTVLLVVITVALVTVLGVFVFTLVKVPEDPPELNVNFVYLNNRWSASIHSTSEQVEVSNMRIIARHPNGNLISYDTDGDAVPDTLLAWDMDEISVTTGDGPQPAPVIYVDSDGDGRTSVGDVIVAYAPYYYPVGPLMDDKRGYKLVGPNPNGIPRGSDMFVAASPITLGNDDIEGGDVIRVDIKHGASLMATTEGPASVGGVFEDTIDVAAGWSTGSYDAIFTIRPGEIDEWSVTFTFMVLLSSPISPAQEAAYHNSSHPVGAGDIITIIHKPTNSVALEFKL